MRQLAITSFVGVRPWAVAEERVRRFLEAYRPRWLYVMFSGGRDSSAVLAAALSVTRRVVAVYVHIAGQTHAVNLRAAKRVAERLNVPFVTVGVVRRREEVAEKVHGAIEEHGMPIVVHMITVDFYTGLDYWAAVEAHGLPAPAERGGKGHRWCCLNFKAKWLWRLPRNAIIDGRPARAQAAGIRWEESWYRRRAYRVDTRLPVKASKSDDGATNYTLLPIIDMTLPEVTEMLEHYGILDVVEEQYRLLGFSPNCILCPLANREMLERAVRILPDGYLLRVLAVLEKLESSGRLGSFTSEKLSLMKRAILEELRRRGVHYG